MNAMPLVITSIALFVLAYRFYFSFIAAKVLTLDDFRETPAGRLFDGQNYYPMNKWLLFGHHFAAIAGAGPLVGSGTTPKMIMQESHIKTIAVGSMLSEGIVSVLALIGTSYIINRGKIKYAWVTIIPLVFVGITTFSAGILNMKGIYIPQLATSAHRADGIINLSLTLIIMTSVVIIFRDAIPGWISAWGPHSQARSHQN
jgi:carbon starvation protein